MSATTSNIIWEDLASRKDVLTKFDLKEQTLYNWTSTKKLELGKDWFKINGKAMFLKSAILAKMNIDIKTA